MGWKLFSDYLIGEYWNSFQQAAAPLLIFVFYLAKHVARAYSATVFQSIEAPQEIN